MVTTSEVYDVWGGLASSGLISEFSDLHMFCVSLQDPLSVVAMADSIVLANMEKASVYAMIS